MSSQVPAATRTLAILRTLASAPAPMSAVAIARALELPRSSTYHLLAAMAEMGFVVHIPEEERWALGVSAFEIGAAYLRHDPLERLAKPLLEKTVKEISDASVVGHLGVLHGAETMYLLKVQPRKRIEVVTEVGVRLPAHITASGRSMLSALPLEQAAAHFPRKADLISRTGTGPQSWKELSAVLAQERTQGFSYERGEIDEDFSSVAVAVLDHLSHPVASIGLTFRTNDVTRTQLTRIVSLAQRCARQLSRRIGAA